MASRVDSARRLSTAKIRAAGLAHGARAGLRRPTDFAWLLGDWAPPPVASPATESDAMGIPAFGRAVELLANAVASTEWHAERWDPVIEVPVRLADQPAVLTDPFPTTSTWHYKWAATEDLVLYGNHFAVFGDLDFRTGRPGWVAPISADDVWILQAQDRPWDFQWAIGGTIFDRDEILHVSAGNRSGEILGRGALNQYAPWLGGAVAAEDHASGYFAGGALPPAVLSANTVVTQPQADDLKQAWRRMTSTREPVVLPQGYTLTPVVSDAVQAQLVESRTWNAEQIANAVGIPSWKLGLSGGSMVYRNIESGDIDFVRDSVDHWAGALSQAYTKWLMPRGTSVAWDWASRMRSDQESTATVLSTLVGAKIMTIDEARAHLSRPPLPPPATPPPPPPPPPTTDPPGGNVNA